MREQEGDRRAVRRCRALGDITFGRWSSTIVFALDILREEERVWLSHATSEEAWKRIVRLRKEWYVDGSRERLKQAPLC